MNQVCSRKNLDVIKLLVLVTKLIVNTMPSRINTNSISNDLINGEARDWRLDKYRLVMEEYANLTSTNSGFWTINHCVATYEQTKKELSFFYPKRKVLPDGAHTVPLNL